MSVHGQLAAHLELLYEISLLLSFDSRSISVSIRCIMASRPCRVACAGWGVLSGSACNHVAFVSEEHSLHDGIQTCRVAWADCWGWVAFASGETIRIHDIQSRLV